MANRKPTNVLALKGSFKKNPARKRIDPQPAAEIGSPPDHLSDAEKQIWKDVVAESPAGVLQASDRLTLEVVASLMAEYRADKSQFTPAKIGVLQRGLSSLGYTPVDRARLGVSARQQVTDDPWAEFAASK